MYRLIIFFLLQCGTLQAEPSAFGAGNLDSSEPYGLTTVEKKIVENQKNLQNAKYQSRDNSAQLASLRERMDGLQTVMEGLAQQSRSNKLSLSALEAEAANAPTRDARISALEMAMKTQSENMAALKTALAATAVELETINSEYISKAEYNGLVEEFNAFKAELRSSLRKKAAPASDAIDTMSSAEMAKEAKQYYDQLFFKKAIPMYEELIRRGYKPAYANFMLGEMWHYRKQWSKALAYYKRSHKIYDRAAYMPTLLLHSAECMKETGETQLAEKFLRSLVAHYPQSQEAASAKTMLNAL